MRDRHEIEREMFAAREDLEISVAQLVHRARERAAVPERASHAIREFARDHRRVLIAVAAGIAIAVVGGSFVVRAYRLHVSRA
jgi:hypothetical protein